MRQYQQLIIYGDPIALNSMLVEMKSVKSGDFVYADLLSRKYAKSLMTTTSRAVCFKSSKKSLLQARAWLVLYEGKFVLTNITSPMYSGLNIMTYNVLLDSFYRQYEGLIDRFADHVEVTCDNKSLDNYLPEETYSALLRWEHLCNKEHPISHEEDATRWRAFIESAFRNHVSLKGDELHMWLMEDQQWPEPYEDQAIKMAELFDYSLSILNYCLYGDK